ncbi:MAG: BON domain-containing protein [Candidatus Lariskella arthropodorum]
MNKINKSVLKDMMQNTTNFYEGRTFRAVLMCITLSFTLISAGCALFIPVAAVTAGAVMMDQRSIGAVVDDNVIFTKIKGEFGRFTVKDVFTKVAVNVKEGRVMLTGAVKEEYYKHEAVRIVWGVMGVKEVIDEIIVSSEVINSANDTWIANQVRSKFLFRKNMDSVNYTIAVNNSVVFLFGIAQDQAELDLAIEIVSSVKGVRKVINHVLLSNDQRRRVP